MSLQTIRLDVYVDPCLASAPLGNVFDLRGPDFLLFYTILLLLGVACAFVLRQLLRGRATGASTSGRAEPCTRWRSPTSPAVRRPRSTRRRPRSSSAKC